MARPQTCRYSRAIAGSNNRRARPASKSIPAAAAIWLVSETALRWPAVPPQPALGRGFVVRGRYRWRTTYRRSDRAREPRRPADGRARRCPTLERPRSMISTGRRIARAIHQAKARLATSAVSPPPKASHCARLSGSTNSLARPSATVHPLIGDCRNAECTGIPSLVTLGNQPSRLFEICARKGDVAGWPIR